MINNNKIDKFINLTTTKNDEFALRRKIKAITRHHSFVQLEKVYLNRKNKNQSYKTTQIFVLALFTSNIKRYFKNSLSFCSNGFGNVNLIH